MSFLTDKNSLIGGHMKKYFFSIVAALPLLACSDYKSYQSTSDETPSICEDSITSWETNLAGNLSSCTGCHTTSGVAGNYPFDGTDTESTISSLVGGSNYDDEDWISGSSHPGASVFDSVSASYSLWLTDHQSCE